MRRHSQHRLFLAVPMLTAFARARQSALWYWHWRLDLIVFSSPHRHPDPGSRDGQLSLRALRTIGLRAGGKTR